MAGEGRQHGADSFDIAARREDLAVPPPDDLALPDETSIPQARRWPYLVKRWSALIVAFLVGAASIVILGRSLSRPEEKTRAQELEGRSPERLLAETVDLSPDWTHTRNLDRRRTDKQHQRKKPKRKSRHATVRVAGRSTRGGSSSMTVASAPAPSDAPTRTHQPKNTRKKQSGHKDQAEQDGPGLPDPAVPLYHLYRTFKKKKPNHYFTGDAALKDEKVEEGWQFLATEGFMFDRSYEGTVAVPADNGTPGYIYEKKEPGSLPLYMLRGYNGYGDIFTSDEAYKDKMIEEGWNDFGVVGYIAQT